jgi:hypothetical protein
LISNRQEQPTPITGLIRRNQAIVQPCFAEISTAAFFRSDIACDSQLI